MATATDRILQIVVKAKDEATSTMNRMGDNMDSLSGHLGVAGAAVTGFGVAGAFALNNLSNTASEYASSVQTVQRLTGDTAEQSSELAAVFGRLGVSSDGSAKIIKTLSTNIVENSDAMRNMGVATTNADGSLRASGDVLKDVANYYANSTDKTAALANVSKVLGRNYADLLPALSSGGDYFDKTAEKAKKYGLVLGQDGVDTNAKYKSALADNKMALLGLQVQFGLAVLPVKTFIEGALAQAIAMFNNLPGPVKKAAETLAVVAVAAALIGGPLMMMIGFLPQLSSGFGLLEGALGKTGLKLPGVIAQFGALGTAQKLALLGGVGLIAGLVALAVYMGTSGTSADEMAQKVQDMADKAVQAVTDFAAKLPEMVNAFTSIITAMVPKITAMMPQITNAITQAVMAIVQVLPTLIPPLLNAAVTLFKALITAITQILPALMQALIQIIMAIVAMLPTIIPVLLQAAVQLFMALVQALPQILSALLDAAIALIQAVVAMLPTLIPAVLNAAVQLFLALVQSLPIILPELINAAIQAIVAVANMLPTLIPELINAGIILFMALVQAVPQIAAALIGAVIQLIQQAWDWLVSGGAQQMADAGWNIIQGLVNGIQNAAGQVWDAIVGCVQDGINGALRALGIASPSKVFYNIGQFTGQGLANGISSMASTVKSAASGLAQSAITAVSGTKLNIGVTGSTGYTGGFATGSTSNGTTVINKYQIGDIHVPDGDKDAQEAISEFVGKMKRYARMQPSTQGAI